MANISPINTAQSAAAPSQTNPSLLQDQASFPATSSWVGASAGTGKTKVLTDRVLRLLLPQPPQLSHDNIMISRPGNDPSRILCLTFTKAGAAEMALRINKRLAQWAVMDDDRLTQELSDLTHMDVDDDLRKAARQLFASVIDAPGGLKIMTIHSFCQSILGRFPLEAGIAPNFDILSDHLADQYMTAARDHVLKRYNPSASSLSDLEDIEAAQALHYLTQILNESQLNDSLRGLNAERSQVLSLFDQFPTNYDLRSALAQMMDINAQYIMPPPNDTASDNSVENGPISAISPQFYFDELCDNAPSSPFAMDDDLWPLCRALYDGNKTNQGQAITLQAWLEKPPQERKNSLDDFLNIFFTKDLKDLRSLNRSATEAGQKIAQLGAQIGDRLIRCLDKQRALENARQSYALLVIGRLIQDHFAQTKKRRNMLDFEDLVRLTRNLLSGKTTTITNEDPSAWVLFKLDGGIDHILVDEAQDTNPEQWEIIERLSSDFFHGLGARSEGEQGITRTIFVVGDDKQSIFSFQRADPDKFHDMRRFFQDKIQASQNEIRIIALNTSFRSTQPVLDMVNQLFNHPQGRQKLGLNSPDDITHIAHRSGAAGRVELWDLMTAQDNIDPPAWDPPITIQSTQTPKARLCRTIAERIRQMLDEPYIIPSKNRPATPGDIMILLRERKDFAAPLIKELKSMNIPVSGLDRMVLSQELVVEDMLALAEFALLPEDDLSLACILRSPIMNLDEDALFQLAHYRGDDQSLWSALRDKTSQYPLQVGYLERLIRQAGDLRPYEFFAGILYNDCPVEPSEITVSLNKTTSALKAIQQRLGQDAIDPLHEFLALCLQYEQDELPNLQGFIHWMRENSGQIKRDQEEARNQIRIMTVHGSKGLQAPIVFMPDTTITPQALAKKRPAILWPNRTSLPLPLWSQSRGQSCDIYKKAQDKITYGLNQEYNRLLYVALTRAEDHLIIAGVKGSQNIIEDSWYNQCRDAFTNMQSPPAPANFLDHQGEPVSYQYIACDQRDTPPRPLRNDGGNMQAPHISYGRKISDDLPQWLFTASKAEPQPPRPLTPSRPSLPDQPSASPRKNDDNDYRFQRGRITHKLLEYLPDLPRDQWHDMARQYVFHAVSDLSDTIKENIIDEALALLHNPQFADIFGPDSMAEVPINGLIGKHKLVSGQIDRLLIRDDIIMIIDYKTNRPPPLLVEDVPQIYIDQMRSYAQILSQIYTDRPVKTALIWTDGPRLMDLTDLIMV